LIGTTLGSQQDVLARGASSTLLKYQGYDINGFTLYTKKQDRKSTYQNSGVRFDAHNENSNVHATYCAFIEEIWELDYSQLKVAPFRCQWVRLEAVTTNREGFTTVDLTKAAYIYDPFALAKDVMQIFYVGDNKTKRKLK
jgi:hypothetical protein